MHNNRNNRETVNIPQTITAPTKSIIVASYSQETFLIINVKNNCAA